MSENSPFCVSAPPPNIFMWEKMNFLPHENVEIPVDPAPRRVSFNIFMREKFIFEDPLPVLMLLGWLFSSVNKKKNGVSWNLVIFRGFRALTRPKNVVEVFRKAQTTRLNEI